jgi:hypothetical protein
MTGCSQYHMNGVAQLLMERECSLNKQEMLRQVGKEKRVESRDRVYNTLRDEILGGRVAVYLWPRGLGQ